MPTVRRDVGAVDETNKVIVVNALGVGQNKDDGRFFIQMVLPIANLRVQYEFDDADEMFQWFDEAREAVLEVKREDN